MLRSIELTYTSGETYASQSEVSALSQEGHQLPMWDQVGESRVYVRLRKPENLLTMNT